MYFRAKEIIAILTICVYINLGLCQLYDNPENFPTKATGTKSFSLDRSTGVNVTKTVDGINGKPLIQYEIKTPIVDNFEFVIALDSSGSFGRGGDIRQGEAVIYAVPKFIEDVISNQKKNMKYQGKEFNISILSWDDNIDFAYGSLSNKDPKNAELIPIKTAKNDTQANLTFTKVYEPEDGDYLSGKYYIGESEGTNLSLAVEASLTVLNESYNPINKNKRTHRFIILVAGPSESPKIRTKLIEDIKKSNIPIYVIGLDINDGSQMMVDLEQISDSRNASQRFKNIKSIGDQLNEYLAKALEESLDEAILDPVAENVKLVDSFYSYLDPAKSATINTVDNTYNLLGAKTFNADNTTTMTFELPLKLLPNSTTNIEFGIRLNLKGLPVSITKNPKNSIFNPIGNDTQISHVSYLWTVNEKREVYLDLPETQINIESSEEESTTARTTEEGASQPSGNNEMMIVALLSFAIIYSIMKQRN